LIAIKECQAVEIVKQEIDAIGTPGLRAWAKAHSGLFVLVTPEIQIESAGIAAKHPDLMDPKSTHESADVYVIAFAKLTGGIVVSQETSAQEKNNPRKKYYIPDVCRDLGVACLNLLGLMRREKWSF